MRGALDQISAIVWKDLLSELRTKEVVNSALLFAVMVLVIFNFAFDLRVENVAAVAPGVLWVTFTFGGVLTLGRAFARERDRGTLEGLLLAPVDRGAIYLAKLLTNVAFMLLVELVALPVFVALFNVPLDWGLALLVVLLGTLGFAGVGTLFAAMAAHTRAREVMLPLLLFPIALPVVIATAKATGAAIGPPQGEAAAWLNLLVGFDAIFLTLSFILIEYVLEE
ncbi:MAG: heme exporter protein CcmB [Chloroflexi bacterium]|nr:heme exporter protein CcmB [Chloroflexota bacterium]